MKIAVLSTYNSNCGIAEYTRELYAPLLGEHEVFFLANVDALERTGKDDDHVLRLWETGEPNFNHVLVWLREAQPDILHIQLHGNTHFSLTGIRLLLKEAKKLPKSPKLFLTAHTVRAPGFDLLILGESLKWFDTILVHRRSEVSFLQSESLANVRYFRYPFDIVPPRDQITLKHKLGLDTFSSLVVTHGLIAPHKGFTEAIKAISLVKSTYPKIGLLCLTALGKSTDSLKTYAEMQKLVKKLGLSENVTIIPLFLSQDELYLFLQATDIGVLAYSEVGESASGAARRFISAGLPTIVTDVPIMAEFTEEVYKVKDGSAPGLAQGIQSLLQNPGLDKEIQEKALATSQANSWEKAAQTLLSLYMP